ncbi:MAG: OmpA family protein [Verrucomicrobiae bacterium]|nr:OmpA family protein [Verrucomicrobiae bacterium]
MKRAVFLPFFVVGLTLVLGAAGCKNPPKGVTQIPTVTSRPVPGTVDRQGPIATTPTTPTPGTGAQLRPDESITSVKLPESPSGYAQPSIDELIEGMVADTNYFRAQTVYFDFDSSLIKTTEYPKIHAVGDALKSRTDTKLMIDGHCDERGTEEYNRALGERRALAIREALIKYGIAPERMSTRSWGEDRPAVLGHNEEAWSKNRRGEFILLLPKKKRIEIDQHNVRPRRRLRPNDKVAVVRSFLFRALQVCGIGLL